MERRIMEIGYIGLGAMGGALARRLMLSHKLRVHDLRPDMVEEFAKNGAIPTQSGTAMARECDVVMICVPRSANVRDAIFGEGGLAVGLEPGKIIIDQTSGDPDETRQMAAELAEKGITLIDAPVSGGPAGADAGTIAIMAAGPLDVFEKVKPVFESISPNVFHCGDTGNAHVVKLVNNTIAASCRLATLEAVAMGRKYGLSLDIMTDVINKSSGSNNTSMNALPKMLAGEPTSNFGLALMLKDVGLATQMGAKCGAPMFIANMVRGMLQTSVHDYGDNVDMDATIWAVEKAADTKFVG
jgi:3-hydroxyisobutyrate dehydrogenase